MKFWVMAIFSLSERLARLARRVDKDMESLSVSMTVETVTLFEAMLALEDKKRRICNFKVFKDLMVDKLKPGELEIVSRYIKGEVLQEIADDLKISKSTAARKFNRAMDVCGKYLVSMTFTEERFLAEYKDIPLIWRTVKQFGRNAL